MRPTLKCLALVAASVCFQLVLLQSNSIAALVADLAGDYSDAANVGDSTATAGGGLAGTVSGQWNYYSDDDGVIDGDEVLLTYANTFTSFAAPPAPISRYVGTNTLFGDPNNFAGFPLVTNGQVFDDRFTLVAPGGFLQMSPGDSNQPENAVLMVEYRATTPLTNVVLGYNVADASLDSDGDGVDFTILEQIGGAVTSLTGPTNVANDSSADTGDLIQSISNLAAGDSIWFVLDGVGGPNSDATNVKLTVNTVPEPSAFVLLSAALAAAGSVVRFRSKR